MFNIIIRYINLASDTEISFFGGRFAYLYLFRFACLFIFHNRVPNNKKRKEAEGEDVFIYDMYITDIYIVGSFFV